MGRNLKVTNQEVLEKIKEEGSTTKLRLANEFDVCPATISSRLKTLREDSEPIFFDEEGLFFFDGIESITDIERLEKYRDWVTKTLIGVVRCSKPIKPIAIEFKEKFKELTTREERTEMKRFFLKMEKMIEYLEVDEED